LKLLVYKVSFGIIGIDTIHKISSFYYIKFSQIKLKIVIISEILYYIHRVQKLLA
jgi:hypothetical protein